MGLGENNSDKKQAAFIPYRTLGIVSGDYPPKYPQNETRRTLVAWKKHSFRIVQLEKLDTVFDSPILKQRIYFLECTAKYTYLATKRALLIFKRETRCSKITLPKEARISAMTICGETLLVLLSNGTLFLVEEAEKTQTSCLKPKLENVYLCGFSLTEKRFLLLEADGRAKLYNLKTMEATQVTKTLEGHPTATTETQTGAVAFLGFSSGEILALDLENGRVLFTLKQSEAITALCFVPSRADILFVGTKTGTIQAWQLDNRTPLFLHKKVHKKEIIALLSFGKENIVSAGKENVLYSWTVEKNRLLLSKKKEGQLKPSKQIRFYGEETKWILSTDGCSLWMFSMFSERQNQPLSSKKASQLGKIKGFDFSTTLHHRFDNVASCQFLSNELHLWSTDKKTISNIRLNSAENVFSAVSVSFCGNYVAGGTVKGMIHVFRIQSGLLTCSYSLGKRKITAINFSAAGRLLSGDAAGRLKISCFKTGEILLTKKLPAPIQLLCSSFGDYLFVIATTNQLFVFDAEKMSFIRTFLKLKEKIVSCAFSQDKRMIVSAAKPAFLDLWDVISGSHSQRIPTKRLALSLSLSPCGFFLAAALKKKRGIHLFSYRPQETGKTVTSTLQLPVLKESLEEPFVRFSEDREKWKALLYLGQEVAVVEEEVREPFLLEVLKDCETKGEPLKVETFEDLKSLGRAAAIVYISQIQEAQVDVFLWLLHQRLSEKKDFDLILAYLLIFLEKKRDLIENREELRGRIRSLRETIERLWEGITDAAQTTRCLLGILK